MADERSRRELDDRARLNSGGYGWQGRLGGFGDWLDDLFGTTDRNRRAIAEREDAEDRDRDAREREALKTTSAANFAELINQRNKAMARYNREGGYQGQREAAELFGGTASYDLNGDGQIGPGESMTIDPTQSAAGRYELASRRALGQRGLGDSTLGLGEASKFSKNLQDRAFQGELQRKQEEGRRSDELADLIATLGNQAGTTYTIDPVTGEVKYTLASKTNKPIDPKTWTGVPKIGAGSGGGMFGLM